MEVLQCQNLWDVVKLDSIPHSVSMLGKRFAHTLKNYGTRNEKSKVRYTAQVFSDRDKL